MGKIKDIAELLQIKVTSLLEKQSQTPTSHTNVQDLHVKCARYKDHKESKCYDIQESGQTGVFSEMLFSNRLFRKHNTKCVKFYHSEKKL